MVIKLGHSAAELVPTKLMVRLLMLARLRNKRRVVPCLPPIWRLCLERVEPVRRLVLFQNGV